MLPYRIDPAIRSLAPVGALHNPYDYARREYLAGRLHSAAAVGLLVADLDWRAQCEMKGWNALQTARSAVHDVWALEAIAAPKG